MCQDEIPASPGLTDSLATRILLDEAGSLLDHRFDILGTGLQDWGRPISWHEDIGAGHVWPLRFYKCLSVVPNRKGGPDVKVPWEISRFHHLLVLGRAYGLTRDERYVLEVVGQVSEWLDRNPYLYGVHWTCAMEVALRACNWLWGYWFFRESPAWTEEFNQRFFQSLWQHGQFIERNLEDRGQFSANHYLADVVGLLFLGILCPQFREAERWKTFGVRELVRCMEEQVYSDGVSFENSIGYHRLVLELFAYSAILCQRNGIELPPSFWERLEKMFEFVLHYTRPDGRAPHIGDSDDGRFFILSHYYDWDRWDHRYLLSLGAVLFHRADFKAAAGQFHEEVWWLLGAEGQRQFEGLPEVTLSLPSAGFAHGGLYFLRHEDIYAAVVAAPTGVNGLGPHKHNDTLSFELCVGNQPILVDPGTYCYTGDPEARRLFRSTASHNTVMVDGVEQNDLQGVFDLPRNQVHPQVLRWESNEEYDLLEVEHDGYLRLPEPVVHRRQFYLEKALRRLTVTDTLTGRGEHTVSMFYHFAPGLLPRLAAQDERSGRLEVAGVIVNIETSAPGRLALQEGWVSERYNRKEPAWILRLDVGPVPLLVEIVSRWELGAVG